MVAEIKLSLAIPEKNMLCSRRGIPPTFKRSLRSVGKKIIGETSLALGKGVSWMGKSRLGFLPCCTIGEYECFSKQQDSMTSAFKKKGE